MTLLVVEGFDYLGDGGEKYLESNDTNVTLSSTTRHGVGKSCRIAGNNSIQIPVPGSQTVIYYGFAFKSDTFYDSYDITIVYAGSTADFSMNPVGGSYLRVLGANILRGYTSRTIRPNIWYYIEVKYTLTDSSSAGDVSVRINDEEVFSCGAGEDYNYQAASHIQYVYLRGCASSGYTYVDDFYLCNNSGAKNNTFLGDCKIDWLMPNGNGNANQFTGSDADSTDNYLHVDEIGPDEDTSYVESSTASQLDQYAIDNLAETPTTIHGVSVSARVRKDDAGSRTGRIVLRSGGSNYEGSDIFPGTDFEYFDEVWENDPATATAWTATGVNAAEVGIKVQS